MIATAPLTLEGHGIRLEPLAVHHADALTAAASDGKLWELWYTSVPEPGQTKKYIDDALEGQRAIAAIGAKQDGVLRHHQARRDGSARDSVMFSILAHEWRDVKRHLELRLFRHEPRGV